MLLKKPYEHHSAYDMSRYEGVSVFIQYEMTQIY